MASGNDFIVVCFAERDCAGITLEVNSTEWTLRSGKMFAPSKLGGISRGRNCFELLGHTPRCGK